MEWRILHNILKVRVQTTFPRWNVVTEASTILGNMNVHRVDVIIAEFNNAILFHILRSKQCMKRILARFS